MRRRLTQLAVAVALLLPALGVWRVLGGLPWTGADWWVALGLMLSPAVALVVLWNPFHTTTLRAISLHMLTAMSGYVLLVVALRSSGVAAGPTAVAMVVVAAALSLAALIRLPRLQWQGDAADLPFLALGLVFLALLNLRNDASFATMMGAHGMWHTACAVKSLQAVPPECPVFAGQPYYMYWAYDLYLAQFSVVVHRTLAEISPLTARLVFPVLAAAYALGAVLFKTERWRWTYAVATLAGLNGLGSLMLAARLAANHADLAAYLTYDRLNELAISYRWNGCVFSLPVGFSGGGGIGFAPFFGVLYLAVCARAHCTRLGPAALVVLLVAAALMLHPVTGAVAVMAALIFSAATWATTPRGDGSRRAALLVALASLAGAAVAAPMLLGMTGNYADPSLMLILDQPRVMAKQVWDLAGPWLWTVPLVPLGIVQVLRGRHPQAVPFLAVSTVLTVLAIAFRLPWDNQYKFVYLQAPFLCAVALLGLAAVPWRRLRRVIVGALLTILMLTMLAGGFVNRLRYTSKPFPYAPHGGEVAMADQSGDVAALWGWVAANTTPEAVIIEAPHGVNTETTLLEPTIIAGRTGFTSTAGRAYVPYTKESWQSGGYPDCELREAIANALSAGRALTPDQWRYLRALGRPLYLLLRAENTMVQARADAALRADAAHFRPVFDRGGLRLYQIAVPGEG